MSIDDDDDDDYGAISSCFSVYPVCVHPNLQFTHRCNEKNVCTLSLLERLVIFRHRLSFLSLLTVPCLSVCIVSTQSANTFPLTSLCLFYSLSSLTPTFVEIVCTLSLSFFLLSFHFFLFNIPSLKGNNNNKKIKTQQQIFCLSLHHQSTDGWMMNAREIEGQPKKLLFFLMVFITLSDHPRHEKNARSFFYDRE